MVVHVFKLNEVTEEYEWVEVEIEDERELFEGNIMYFKIGDDIYVNVEDL